MSPAWAIGLLISLAMTALYISVELVYQAANAATIPLWTTDHVGGVIARALVLGYIPTAVCYVGLAVEQKDRELRPLTGRLQSSPSARWYHR